LKHNLNKIFDWIISYETSKIVKALLLSAGLGTRLKPLTDNTPKCLLPINNKPILYHWLDLLEKENIDEVLINIYYFAEKIEESIKKRGNIIKITLFYEPHLLGSAGTIFANKDYFCKEDNFLLLYSDNFTNVSLRDIIDFHNNLDSVYTTYVYETDNPTAKGIFEYDLLTGKVISFEEKPENPKTTFANAGIGVLNKRIFDYITSATPLDFGRSVMPLISDKMYVLKTENYIIDIGTIEDYKFAQDLAQKKQK
jgi:mannose-1-phosphate guanylyltransferase